MLDFTLPKVAKKATPERRSQRAVPVISHEQNKVFQALESSVFSLDQFTKGYKVID
jgi:hypothetical protein